MAGSSSSLSFPPRSSVDQQFLLRVDTSAFMQHHRRSIPTITDDPFRCKSCLKNFETTVEMDHHVAKAHLKQRQFTCHQCAFVSQNFDLLKHHLQSHKRASRQKAVYYGKQFYTCHLCTFSCALFPELKEHLKGHRCESEPFKCHLCRHKCSEMSEFRTHLLAHKGQHHRFNCHLCGFTNSEFQEFKAHLQDKHAGEKAEEVKQRVLSLSAENLAKTTTEEAEADSKRRDSEMVLLTTSSVLIQKRCKAF